MRAASSPRSRSVGVGPSRLILSSVSVASVKPEYRSIPRVLSIAGSDSGGGAGIQADLKAFARCGVHGMTAITGGTWQNTVAVQGVTAVRGEAVVGQESAA